MLKHPHYAETIGQRKFVKLSSKRQHELLALLARDALKTGDFPGFLKRYREMQSWAELDQYTPPEWLTDEEAAHEYYLFHSGFNHNPIKDESEYKFEEQEHSVSWQHRFDVTVVLDQVRSPFNAGSVLRLIDNFGFRRLVHNSSWLRMDHPQFCKAARGSEKWIPVELKSDLIDWLEDMELPVIGLENDPNAISIEEWHPKESCVLIVGSEVYGIAQALREQCDTLIKIPMLGFKQSMNLHHTLAITGHKIVSAFNG